MAMMFSLLRSPIFVSSKNRICKSTPIISKRNVVISTQDIYSRCSSLISSIIPLNNKLRGPLEKNTEKNTTLPFVFLIGNHSSGKSSFINYILQREIQTTGVAPTDDFFTVIRPGTNDSDMDGPTLIDDPDLGFSGLKQFGPNLIHHTQMKIRKGLSIQDFMLIDSPGMIDSPLNHMVGHSVDRGYDFSGVAKWFSERADVVLLFFDPDKPGTTGESLSVMTTALAGIDHKLLIILNKADQFKLIHDFARAYGSLCWNLSKVILRKDLPRIYTMCLPVAYHQNTSHITGISDLERTREEVVDEVMRAPKRRIDNTITRLSDCAHLLHVYSSVFSEARRTYRKILFQTYLKNFGVFSVSSFLIGSEILIGASPQTIGFSSILSVAAIGGIYYLNLTLMQKMIDDKILSIPGLNQLFERVYPYEAAENDAFTVSIWQRVRERLRASLISIGIHNLPKISNAELKHLQTIIEKEVPELRRSATTYHIPSQQNFIGEDKKQ